MHRVLRLVLGLMVVLMCAGTLVVASEGAKQGTEGSMCIPLGTITLKPPESVEAKRAPVEFPHSLHFEISCQDCHHDWVGDEEIPSCLTSGCHDLEQAPKKGDGEEPMLYYKAAYHTLCISCHKEIKAQNEKLAKVFQNSDAKAMPTGPTGCVKCHPKE